MSRPVSVQERVSTWSKGQKVTRTQPTVPSEMIHTPWLIPHFVTAWIQNWFDFSPISTQYPIMTKWKHAFRNVSTFYWKWNITFTNVYTPESILCWSIFSGDYEALLARLLRLVELPALGRVWVFPCFFPFANGDLCALGNFQHSRNCFILFPRYMPHHNSISEVYLQFLGLRGIVSALTCTVNCGELFLSHVQTIKLATGGLQSSCIDISRMIKGNWMICAQFCIS
jgi:hypothetical protein